MGQESNTGWNPEESAKDEHVPLTGEALDAAVACMEREGFLDRLTARIMNIAARWGFYSPDEEDVDLPGGKSAGDLAIEITEKAYLGVFTWDREEYPDFEEFCLSRARSALWNWLKFNKKLRLQSTCPLPGKNDESGDPTESLLSAHSDPNDINTILTSAEGTKLTDDFMAEFALSLDNDSIEQKIALAVIDDRECLVRATCIEKLTVNDKDYDAAFKRLKRRMPAFKKSWCAEHKVGIEDWKGMQ